MVKENQQQLQLLFSRRSVRIYAPGEIPAETIQSILEGAMAAPSAMAKDPWRFVVIRDKQMLARLPAVLPGGSMLPAASAAILVSGDLDATFERNLSFLLQDCSACIENLLLAATALGVGSCWVGIHPAEKAIRDTKALFALPSSFVPLAMIALGYPGEEPGARTRFSESYVRNEQWGK